MQIDVSSEEKRAFDKRRLQSAFSWVFLLTLQSSAVTVAQKLCHFAGVEKKMGEVILPREAGKLISAGSKDVRIEQAGVRKTAELVSVVSGRKIRLSFAWGS